MKTIFLIITVYVAVRAEGCFLGGRGFGGCRDRCYAAFGTENCIERMANNELIANEITDRDDHHHHHHGHFDFDRSDLRQAEYPQFRQDGPYATPQPQYYPEYNQEEDYSPPKTQLYYQTIPSTIPQSQLAPPRNIPIHYPSIPYRNDFNYFERQQPGTSSQAAGVYPGWYKPDIPVALRLPNSQTVLIPVRAVYTLPSFIERLVQRIQTVYSVYNPPESLTLDRPLPGRPPVQAEEVTVPVKEGPPAQEEELPVSLQSTTSTDSKPLSEEAPDVNQVVQSSLPLAPENSLETVEEIKEKISTLAVFEVTPFTTAGAPSLSSTEGPKETPKEEPVKESPTEPPVGTTPEADHQTTPMETTTDADNYISPEKIPDENDLKLLTSREN